VVRRRESALRLSAAAQLGELEALLDIEFQLALESLLHGIDRSLVVAKLAAT